MHLKTVFASIMIFWSSLYLFHSWLRSSDRFAFRYLSLLDRLGLSLHVGQLRWYTARFNRIFIRLAQCRSRWWNVWFGAGAICGVLLSVASVAILTSVLYDAISRRLLYYIGDKIGAKNSHRSGASSASSSSSSRASSSFQSPNLSNSPKSDQLLTPILPGVNLPADQIGYYLFTLFLCGVLHEVGHAVAANANNIRVNGFGLFVAFIYPGAFVDLNSDSLQSARPWHQLKVYCAGVWHNVVIVLVAVVYLHFSTYALFPLYSTGGGAVVSAVMPDSVISGKRGLQVGDVISKVANCRVKSAEDWKRCLVNQTLSAAHEIPGYCVPVGFILQHRLMPKKRSLTDIGDDSTNNPSHRGGGSKLTLNNDSDDSNWFHECCGVNHTAKDLCFSYRSKELHSTQAACLPARSVSERPSCRLNSDCAGGRRVGKAADVGSMVCVFPAIGNRTRLLRIARPPTSAILFLGNPLELRFTVRVVDFKRRYSFLPVNAPPVIELCCKYLASLSGALALLNVVPCYALDGQYILKSVVDLFLPPDRFSRTCRDVVYRGFRLLGSMLILVNVLLAFYNLWV